MTENITSDEKAIVEEYLRRMRSNDRHPLPSHKVKQFLQVIGAELQRTGELKQEFVDQVVQQLKSEQDAGWVRLYQKNVPIRDAADALLLP